ncbi:MAG TPA: amidase family protein [Opitutaceae bacterium]|nr:amidase family protein [Opitutaceae bacterium]
MCTVTSLSRSLWANVVCFLCSVLLAFGIPESAHAADKKFDVVETTVSDIHAAMKAHTLTAHQLVQLYLDRIAAYDQKGPAINCVISLNPTALEDADKLDAAFAKSGFVGPLHGIPILVKDEIDAAGMATTLGTKEFKDYRPPLDAFTVAKLKKAGAIILGKTTLSEFAAGDAYGSMFGESHNPYDLARTVGGSSGGSGGALAANFSTLAVGEETSSSLRRPAAWGSLAGMRATPGLISRTGMWDGYPVPTAQMGPMARTVTDLAKMLDAMVGYDPEDPITAFGPMHTPKTYTAFLDKNGLKGTRIGVIREPLSPNSDPTADDFKRVDALFQKSLDELKAAGATVMDIVIPDLKELMSKRTSDPARADQALHVYLSRNPNSEFKTQADIDNHPEMAKSFRARSGQKGHRGGGYSGPADPAKILETQYAREQLLINIAKVMADNQLDALAYKATEHEPMLVADAVNPPYKPTKGVSALNTYVIYASTITVPMGFTNNGTLPAGLAFLGLPYSEPTLIKLAYAYEQATHHRMPPKSTPPLP